MMDDRVTAAENLRDYLSQTCDFGSVHHGSETVRGCQVRMGGCVPDGRAGPATRNVATGLGVTLPDQPLTPRIMTRGERDMRLGAIAFYWRPLPGNPEHVELAPEFVRDHLQVVALQHPVKGTIHLTVNKAVVGSLGVLWNEWDRAGVLPDILDIESFAPRFKRTLGTLAERLDHCRSVAALLNAADYLSTHSWGAAYDVNPGKNPQGQPPLPLGTDGTILRLLPAATRLSYAWGGRFLTQDSEHFELGVLPLGGALPLGVSSSVG